MKNFSWIIPGRLAGSEKPGFHGPEEDDFAFLRAQGVSRLVSLTERPLDPHTLERAGLRAIHIPVPNLEPPEPAQVEAFVSFVDESADQGVAVAVHCLYGIGRTGTMLACFLVHRGMKPIEAIAEVRRLRPGSIETSEQAAAVLTYASRLRRPP